jgi:hypothetical protein
MYEVQKPKGKIQPGFYVLVAALVAVLGYFAADQFGLFDKFSGSSSNSNTEVVSQGKSVSAETVSLQDVRSVDNSSSVGIQAPPIPTSGKVRSIIMVGPSGVYNSINMTDGKNFKLLKKGFVPKLINEQAVSSSDLKAIIEKYINDSWNNGVKANGDIQLVVASSVANNPKIQEMLPEFKKSYVVTTTSSETEGAGAFKVAVAPQYQNTAFVMDITPTIIRFTYSTGNGTKTIVAKTGSKYYQNQQSDQQALDEIKSAIAQIPKSNQQLCLVLWAAAEKDLRQGEQRYSAIPNYNGEERATKTGLTLINEVKNLTNANMVLDFESMWFTGFTA